LLIDHGAGDVGELEVQTNASGSMCGLDLVAGETWVLQVFGDEDWVGLCNAARRVDGPSDDWVVELRDAAAAN
jgi:hypothetical protein